MRNMILLACLAFGMLLTAQCSEKTVAPEYVYGEHPLANSISWRSTGVIWDTTTGKRFVSILIIATDWCGWCRKLKAETLTDRSVCGLLEKYFNSCIIDAEEDSLIIVSDTTMSCRDATDQYFRIHGYPTTIFFDRRGNELGRAPGFLDGASFADLLWKVIEMSRSGT